MSKAVRDAQTGIVVPRNRRPADAVATRELLKAYERKPVSKKEELLASIKNKFKTAKTKKGTSKRTTPGTVPSDSSPSNVHKEGKRWIQTLLKQTLSKRTIEARRGRKK